MFVFKEDLNLTKKFDDWLKQRFVDRFFSLTTSVVLLLWSLKLMYVPIYAVEPSLLSLMPLSSGFLFLLSSILLFLDFLNIKFILVRKKIWLSMFLISCVMEFIYLYLSQI